MADYYNNKHMRHLFIESPYYTAEFLNVWMQSDSDEILDLLYKDWNNTAKQVVEVKEFYKKIKMKCPKTIFHGTDIGHQYDTTGKRFLDYLKENNLENSNLYQLTQEAIEQGKYFYEYLKVENSKNQLNKNVDVYRENTMVKNFMREFNKLNNESVMGIYGAAHTGLDSLDFTSSVPCMANQLKEEYGDCIQSQDLRNIPYRVDSIKIERKEYKASYYGKQNIKEISNEYDFREFWRLENANKEFKNSPKTGDILPYSNYLMPIDIGQIFIIDYVKSDGSITRKYYSSNGKTWNGELVTEEFILK